MSEDTLRLFLAVFAVAGIVYVWIGSGMMSKTNRDWWSELPRAKRVVFILAAAATIVQMLI